MEDRTSAEQGASRLEGLLAGLEANLLGASTATIEEQLESFFVAHDPGPEQPLAVSILPRYGREDRRRLLDAISRVLASPSSSPSGQSHRPE